MKFNNNENINTLSTICIIITFLYSIILIVDELFNISYFTYKYTYFYNYGTFTENFNNTQTIECETNRYNVYNNIDKYYLYKDNFNKSYFNYLVIVIATILTIIITISYGVYFYNKFIHTQSAKCSFTPLEKDMSYIKQILRCICEDCHEFIPNCSFNYFILIIIILIIPITYLLKLSFSIDYTPVSNKSLLGFLYISLFILLLFYYSYVIFTNSSSNKLNITLTFFILTIIFISSGYIYNYIYSKYANKLLNTSQSLTSFMDIYKQLPPIKPKEPVKPYYNNENLLLNFNYIKDNDNKPINYDIKKKIFEDYFTNLKDFDNNMKIYNDKYNIYKNTQMTFPQNIYIIDMIGNMLGLNNKVIIYMIILLILLYVVLYINDNNNDEETIINMCIKYLICIISIIILIDAILYYNTYINKYIIYEPLAHYKNDMTVANTKLNLLLNSTDGYGFYNKLINNISSNNGNNNSNNKSITKLQIFENIKRISYDDTKFDYTELSNIDSNIGNISDMNIISDIPIEGFFTYTISIDFTNTTDDNPLKSILTSISEYTCINNNNIDIKSFNFHYSKNEIITIIDPKLKTYYRYIYYKLLYYKYYYEKKLELGLENKETIKTINNQLININNNILKFNLNTYIDKENHVSNINNITTCVSSNDVSVDNLNVQIKDTLKLLNMFKTLTDYIVCTGVNIAQSANNITYNPHYEINKNYYILNNNTIKLPIKITDNNGNEYNIKINDIPVAGEAKISSFNFYSKNTEFKKITINNQFDLIYTTNNDQIYYSLNIVDIPKLKKDNKYTLPFRCYYYKPSIKNKILLCLYNKLVNLKTHFSYTLLQKKLLTRHISDNNKYEMNDTQNDEANLNKIWIEKVRLYYKMFFSAFSINAITTRKTIDCNDMNKSFIFLSPDTNAISYLILLYNLYMIDVNTIENDLRYTIDYLIYNDINTNDNFDIFKTDDNLKSLKSIKPYITYTNKNEKIKEILNIYNNNYNIISLILKLFKNLISHIKNYMLKKIDSNLCNILKNTQKIDIEKALYKYIDDNFNNPLFTPEKSDISTDNSGTNLYTYKYPVISKKLDIKIDKIKELSCIISYYFNICVFLLDNLNIDNNSSVEMDNIKDNYKFYNNNNSKIVQEQLSINCDYYNKYNKLDTKELSYYQVNIDNVSYNFIILMIIFLIILGEPIFIKS